MNKTKEVTKYEQWTPLVICRNQIKNLKRNPRTISTAAKRRLKKIIETDGLLGPVNFNPKTGNVYGGNQRLAILDALEGSDTYYLTVAAAKKLSPARERKAVTYLNSGEAQGDWDLPALAQWLKEDGTDIDPETFGFSQMGLEIVLGAQAEGIFGAVNEATDAVMKDLQDMEDREGKEEDEDEEDEDSGAEEKNAAFERRQKMREKGKQDHEAGDTEKVAYVMFPSRKAREAWMVKHGQPANTRYVDGRDIP